PVTFPGECGYRTLERRAAAKLVGFNRRQIGAKRRQHELEELAMLEHLPRDSFVSLGHGANELIVRQAMQRLFIARHVRRVGAGDEQSRGPWTSAPCKLARQ